MMNIIILTLKYMLFKEKLYDIFGVNNSKNITLKFYMKPTYI